MNRFLLVALLALAGCASDKPAHNTIFDFGPATPAHAPAGAAIGALVVSDVTGSAALDNERMYYRLNYADPQQARSYANSRWSTTPLQMVTQRLKARLGQSGAKVLGTMDAAANVAILRVEVDDFTHSFDSPAQSQGQVILRASLFQGHRLVDQKTFNRKTSAGSLDAAGGARALAASTDAIAVDIASWLAALPPRKE
ncbi:MAG: ABC-type transport auxiliary lipoprotein family protein [Pseudomonadota bacterium]